MQPNRRGNDRRQMQQVTSELEKDKTELAKYRTQTATHLLRVKLLHLTQQVDYALLLLLAVTQVAQHDAELRCALDQPHRHIAM